MPPTRSDSVIAESIRAALRAESDTERAAGQQAYMKSAMPFFGVRVPRTREIARGCAKGESDASVLLRAAEALWDAASRREERYASMALLAQRPLRGDSRVVPLIEHMTRTGQWWDYTDELAHRLAELHDTEPRETAILVRRWATDEDVWIRRVAILSQLGRRDRLDPGVLADTIAPNLGDDEFFIRKAIGWALREFARIDPDWVREYADTHRLSPLSRREALKHLPG